MTSRVCGGLIVVLMLGLAACADESRPKDGDSGTPPLDDGVLVPSGDLGSADGYGPYQGELRWDAPTGARLDASTWYHLWDFTLSGRSTVRLDARGETGTDAYLTLYRWSGTRWARVASNDDCSWRTLDSCLERTLQAGDYLALVSTYEAMFRRQTPVAGYTVELTCRSGACKDLLCGLPGRRDVPTEFVTPDASSGFVFPFEPVYRTLGGPEGDTEERVVEEGDIYRVLDPGTILNLNAYRGLQVIDVREPTAPTIIGRARVAGTPVELYVLDGIAYVLLNNWYGYYGLADDLRVEAYDGGVLLAVDLRDPSNPVVVTHQEVPGYIRTSRLVRGGGSAALYIVTDMNESTTDEAGNVRWESRAVVTSHALRGGAVEPRDHLDLGGYVTDLQATPEALLVARSEWADGRQASRVSVVDISDPSGRLLEGGEVVPAGHVSHTSNMDLRDGVLRIVSGSTWGGTPINHLETFRATDFGDLEPLDHCEFGDGQSLFATLFLDDRAFFVTYLRVDPFHAFALGADGSCNEVSEFVVSGWNNFFRPVSNDARLIGIGMDDTGGRNLSVSLYDVTDLTSREPLVARANVEAGSSWSEATWDDRAFSVLEGVVDVQGRDGRETGLVLLPFTGWNETEHEYLSAVQLFTFSDTTLTRRGVMLQGTPVRRSFLANDETVANLGDVELTLFDHANPDAPEELGRLELAPDYSDLLLYGDHAVRLNRSTTAYSWWGDRTELPPSQAQVVPMRDDLDSAVPVAEIDVPAGATLEQVGRLLVSIDRRAETAESGETAWLTSIEVVDLTDPTRPQVTGSLETDRLAPTYWGGPLIRCFRAPCLPPVGFGGGEFQAVGDTLVYLERVSAEGPGPNGDTRYWQRAIVHVLDLSHPERPVMLEPIALPESEELVSTLADGDRLWIGVQRPELGADREHGLVRHFVRALDLAQPARPALGAPINVPGQLVAVEGANLYTRGASWGERRQTPSLSRSIACEGRAWQQATSTHADYDLDTVALDGAGHLLVSRRLNWEVVNERGLGSTPSELVILEVGGLTSLGTFTLNDWASLRQAGSGRALFSVPGGLLVVSTNLGWLPFAQAYFPVTGWPQELHLLQDRLVFAAGNYGIYDFDLDGFNLL